MIITLDLSFAQVDTLRSLARAILYPTPTTDEMDKIQKSNGEIVSFKDMTIDEMMEADKNGKLYSIQVKTLIALLYRKYNTVIEVATEVHRTEQYIHHVLVERGLIE